MNMAMMGVRYVCEKLPVVVPHRLVVFDLMVKQKQQQQQQQQQQPCSHIMLS